MRMSVVQLHETALFNKIVKQIVNNCTYTLILSPCREVIDINYFINMPEVKLLFARGNSLFLFVGRHSNIGIRLEDIILFYHDDNLNIFMATSL